MSRTLSGYELYKYDWRTELFLDLYKSNYAFRLIKTGQEVVFTQDQLVLDTLSNRKPTRNLLLTDQNGNKYKLSDLEKTKMFGGKGEGFGLDQEKIEIERLSKQIDAAVEKNGGPITIKIGTKSYENIVAVEKTIGTPKSDFHLLNKDGKQVVWISHKYGKSPGDVNQWGGVSKKMEPDTFTHKETQDFIKSVKEQFPDGLPPRTTLFRKIRNKKLKMMAVYGKDFGSDFGKQNVTVVLQGPIKLMKTGNYYTLKANHVRKNGFSLDNSVYEPVFMAIYKGDRDDAGLKGTRLVIAPIGSRKATEI